MTGDHAEAEEVEVTSTIAREDTEVRMAQAEGIFMLLTNLQTMISKIADLSAVAMMNLSH